MKFKADLQKICMDNTGRSTHKRFWCEIQGCKGPKGESLKSPHGNTKGEEGRRLVDLKTVKNPREDLDSNKIIGWWPAGEKDYPHIIGGHCPNAKVFPEIDPPATAQCEDCKKKGWFGFLS